MEIPKLNSGWGNILLKRFTDQITFFASAFIERVFPAFTGIEDEAEKRANQVYTQISHRPYDNSMDLSDAAEFAMEAGVELYEMLWATRQSMISIAIAGLHHLFEQQVHYFILKELMDPRHDPSDLRYHVNDLVSSLEDRNIEVRELECWQHIKELRLLANSIKHGEGWASEDLRKIRPDLFEDPRINMPLFQVHSFPRLVAPLAGEELYPTIDDLIHYEEALFHFWVQLLSTYFDGHGVDLRSA